MQLRARLYIGSFYTGGVACFAYAMAHWSCADPLHYLCHLATAADRVRAQSAAARAFRARYR